MSGALLDCVEIEPDVEVRWSVVWLHGLGADGHDFEPIVPHLGLDPGDGVRFVFPHAPQIPVSVNFGMVMPAWFDITASGSQWLADEAGIRRSQEQVTALVRRENERGVPSARILLAGFSQGGAIALHTALRYPERLVGVLALSAFLVCADALEEERSAANEGLPIFQAHGLQDPMVPLARAEEAHGRLEALGYPVEWHTYPMGHMVCTEELEAIGRWLRSRLHD